MRKFLMIAIVLISALSIGCSNDDDTNDENKTPTLNGKWNLVNVSGGIQGIDQDFQKGTVVWDFNQSDETVTIINNNQLQGVYDGFPSGTYSYGITSPADAEVLVVNEISLGTVDLKINTLTIEQLAIDGVKLSFTR